MAFVADGKLKAIELGGGSTRTLCDVESFYGGSWSPDGTTFVFATLRGGLFSVPANGGAATPLVNRSDATSAEARIHPTILPDGRHFVYLSAPSNVAWLGSLNSKEAPARLLNVG